MNAKEYLSDLDRLTRNPYDEVKMTGTAFNTLTRNITTIEQNILKNSEAIASIKRRNDVNEYLSKEMSDIISSLQPKKKPKFGTKENLIPNIRFTSSPENYEEAIRTSPRCPLTTPPNANELLSKLFTAASNIPHELPSIDYNNLNYPPRS